MKKKISMFLSLALTMQMFAGINVRAAKTDKADGKILYMNDFSTYKGRTPEGMIQTQADNYRIMNYQTEDGNRYMTDYSASVSNISEAVPFDEIIDNGFVHISLDMRFSDSAVSNNRHVTLGLFSTRESYRKAGETLTDNLYGEDVTKFESSAENGSFVPLTRLNSVANANYNAIIDDQEIWCNPNEGNYSAIKPFNAKQWYKTDILVDVKAGTYKMYIDGAEVGSSAMHANHTFANSATTGFTGFKGFGIFRQNTVPEFHIDNLYIAHYNEAPVDIDALVSNDVVSQESASLDIVLTQALASVPTTADITIKDGKGNAVTGFEVLNATNSKFSIDFSNCENLPSGKLVITTDLKGAATNASVEAIEFLSICQKSEAIDKYVIMSEDFEQGLSADWNVKTYEAVEGNKHHTKTTVEATDAEVKAEEGRGNVLQINGDGMYYFFPRTVAAENFVMEFEINYDLPAGDTWSVGFIKNANYDLCADKGIDIYNRSKMFGVTRGSEDTDKLGYFRSSAITTAAADYWTVNETAPAKSMSPDTWHSVKIEYNAVSSKTGDKKIGVSVDGGAYEYVAMLPILSYSTGVAGISFFKNDAVETDAQGTVKIDNVKVYRESGYALNQSFDNYNSTYSSYYPIPYSWRGIDSSEVDASKNYFDTGHRADGGAYLATVEGADYSEETNASDKAIDITTTVDRTKRPNNFIVHRFANSIDKGQPFTVEFDVKYNENGTTSSWTGDRFGVTLTNDTTIMYQGTDNPDTTRYNSILMMDGAGDLKAYRAGKATVSHYLSDGTLNGSNITDISADKVNLTCGVWHNLKMVFNADRSAYKLYVDGSETAYEVAVDADLRGIEDAVTGIGFATRAYNANSGVYIDNLKVYENDDTEAMLQNANKNTIVGVKAELVDGSVTDVAGTLSTQTDKIRVAFSENLNDCANIADAVHLTEKGSTVDLGVITVSGNEIIIDVDTLSEDKKYQLSVAKNIAFTSSSYASMSDNYIQVFDVADEAKTEEVTTEAVFEKYVEFGYVKGSEVEKTLEECWIPVNSISDFNKYDIRHKVQIVNNTSVSVDVIIAVASYVSNDQRLSDAEVKFKTIGAGETYSETDYNVVDINNADFVKGFIWNKNTLKPYTAADVIK